MKARFLSLALSLGYEIRFALSVSILRQPHDTLTVNPLQYVARPAQIGFGSTKVRLKMKTPQLAHAVAADSKLFLKMFVKFSNGTTATLVTGPIGITPNIAFLFRSTSSTSTFTNACLPSA